MLLKRNPRWIASALLMALGSHFSSQSFALDTGTGMLCEAGCKDTSGTPTPDFGFFILASGAGPGSATINILVSLTKNNGACLFHQQGTTPQDGFCEAEAPCKPKVKVKLFVGVAGGGAVTKVVVNSNGTGGVQPEITVNNPAPNVPGTVFDKETSVNCDSMTQFFQSFKVKVTVDVSGGGVPLPLTREVTFNVDGPLTCSACDQS